jgi:serine-type D-Ala-D-Ala carboxypeptidase (penicillin-binding protein 5/6)
MRRGARPLTVLAIATSLAALAFAALAALPAVAAQAATTARAGRAVVVPKPGSQAARIIGGPLMASSGVVVESPAHSKPLPTVPASAWVVANATTGQVLAAKDPHGQFGPASTLKVLTAVTLIPRLNPDATVIASKFATSQQPNIAGLIAGRAYRISDLFQALLLISANDAAVALTEATGSFAHGMALINAEAQHLQAYDVAAKLPNGLPAAGQVVSAYDEALIARQALAIPAFMRYDETLASRFEVKPHHFETMVNQNSLLTEYKGGIGGKIGWTVSSEATYIGMARRNGVTLIVTVLHCTPLQEIASAERLLNWGFAMNGKAKPVGTLVPPLVSPAPYQEAASQPRPVASGASWPGAPASATSYTLAATGVVVAGLGLGSLARTRRRTMTTRQPPQLAKRACRAVTAARGHAATARRDQSAQVA